MLGLRIVACREKSFELFCLDLNLVYRMIFVMKIGLKSLEKSYDVRVAKDLSTVPENRFLVPENLIYRSI